MAKDPAAVAALWAQRLSASTQQITDGINAVSVAPGQAAARQKQVWVNNTAQAANKWAANTAAVTLSDWQNAAITKGVPRIATGATAAQPKMAQFMGKLLPYVASGVGQLPARGDLNANIARMVAWTNYMSKFSS